MSRGAPGMPGVGALSQRRPLRCLNRETCPTRFLSDFQLVPERAGEWEGSRDAPRSRSCPGVWCRVVPSVLPLGDSMDRAGAKLPQGDPGMLRQLRHPLTPRLVPEQELSLLPGTDIQPMDTVAVAVPACAASPPLSSFTSCLGNGKASALLNGLELSRLLPHPSAPAPPSPGKPHP